MHEAVCEQNLVVPSEWKIIIGDLRLQCGLTDLIKGAFSVKGFEWHALMFSPTNSNFR